MRSPFALVAVTGLVVVALTGCTAPAPQPDATSGASSEAVEVRGRFGSDPRVTFPTPLTPGETQCTEVIEGEGPTLEKGQYTLVGLAAFNGGTGAELEVNGFDESEALPLTINDDGLVGLRKGLTCAREGSRVAVVIPPDEGFGPDGNPDAGLDAGESLVLVMDVHRAFPRRADGAPQLTRDGFPAVVLAPNGQPGITVPKSDPPVQDESELEVLKAGSGAVVESGDQVVVQYTGVLWDEGTVFDSTWEKNAPASFVVADDESSEVVPGFSNALIGQKVGSQIGVIIPPEEGYGDEGNATIPGGSTLFFVIDILGVR